MLQFYDNRCLLKKTPGNRSESLPTRLTANTEHEALILRQNFEIQEDEVGSTLEIGHSRRSSTPVGLSNTADKNKPMRISEREE